MDHKMFVYREYVETLKLLVGLENQKETCKVVGMREKSFVLKVRRIYESQTYYLDVFVRPDELGMYFLFALSDEYNNVRVVPQIINDLVKDEKERGELKIFRLESNVDKIILGDIKNTKEERIGFCFWAVKYVLFKGTKDELFGSLLYEFLNEAERVKDMIDSIYSRSY